MSGCGAVLRSGVCGAPVTTALSAMCRHEHLREGRVCDRHARQWAGGYRPDCAACATGPQPHACRLAEVALAAVDLVTPGQAADLAARTLAAIDVRERLADRSRRWFDADRERVASDLAGLRDCGWTAGTWLPSHAARYADGLRRTAALYGVE